MEVPGERCCCTTFFYERSHNFFFKTCSLAFTAKNVSIRKICLGLPEGFRVIDACIKTGVRNARMYFQTSTPIVILIVS